MAGITEQEFIKELRHHAATYIAPKTKIADRYGDGLLADAYLMAKEFPLANAKQLARHIRIDTPTYRHYMKEYPSFVIAIRAGQSDGQKGMKRTFANRLMELAMGMEIEDVVTEDTGKKDKDGKPIIKTRTTKKQLPPNYNALMSFLHRLDPTWNKIEIFKPEQTFGKLDFDPDEKIKFDPMGMHPAVVAYMVDWHQYTKDNTLPEPELEMTLPGYENITRDDIDYFLQNGKPKNGDTFVPFKQN